MIRLLTFIGRIIRLLLCLLLCIYILPLIYPGLMTMMMISIKHSAGLWADMRLIYPGFYIWWIALVTSQLQPRFDTREREKTDGLPT